MFRNRWAAVLGVALIAVVVGVIAYNAGISHGLAQKGIAPPVAGAYPYAWYPYHPWGFGFGFFFPFLFIAFWILVFRGLFWRRGWHHGCHVHEEEKREPPVSRA